MNASFEFATPGRIIFGAGRLREIGPIAAGIGRRVLLVTGARPERAGTVHKQIEEAGCDVLVYPVAGEPTVELVQSAAAQAREADRELVIGFGGGSAVDAAKAVAALTTNVQPALHYLEVIGQTQPLTRDPLPVIAIPTTAGTGAEVTRNAVLHSPEGRVKVSLRSPRMLPRVALVDPEATISLPPEITATTGMDALTQLIESFLSKRANPLTDAICREAIPKIARSLERVYRCGSDLGARTDVSFASLCSGLTLANAGLGAVHGLAAPLGGHFSAPHGAVCAALLLPVLRANLTAARAADQNIETVKRFRELAGLLTMSGNGEAEDVLDWVGGLTARLKISGLARYGMNDRALSTIAEQGLVASSMKGNPVQLERSVLEKILNDAL